MQVGPKSVGYRLTKEARVFGGDTLTTTDIAVASRMAEVGNAEAVADIDPALISAAKGKIAAILEAAVERSRVSTEGYGVIGVRGWMMDS